MCVCFFFPILELDQLTGVAALLRFPINELEDESDESESENEGEE